jgi:hypothetical protein
MAAGHKTPEEKLMLHLESLKAYCTEEELIVCWQETARMLADYGFRAARNYLIALHDQFRLRMRQSEQMEENVEPDTGTLG